MRVMHRLCAALHGSCTIRIVLCLVPGHCIAVSIESGTTQAALQTIPLLNTLSSEPGPWHAPCHEFLTPLNTVCVQPSTCESSTGPWHMLPGVVEQDGYQSPPFHSYVLTHECSCMSEGLDHDETGMTKQQAAAPFYMQCCVVPPSSVYPTPCFRPIRKPFTLSTSTFL
eukprot:jgi/Ulvmu1/2563/UM014_0014.1